MNPQDRLFGEIAVRLRLLSREQVATCMHEQETDINPEPIGQIACRLGYLSSGEMEQVLAQQRAILERRREGSVTQEVPPPAEAQTARTLPNPAQAARAATPTRPASAPVRPRPEPDAATEDDYDFGASVQAGGAQRAPAVDPLGATRLPGVAREAALDARATSRDTGTDTLVEAASGPRARRRSFEQEWRNVSAPPAAPQPTGEVAGVRSTVVQQFRGTMVQHHGAVAAQQAEAERHAAERAAEATEAAARPVSIAPKVAKARPAHDVASLADSYLGKALRMAVQQGASDLHAHSGAPIKLRVDGVLKPLSAGVALTAEAAQQVIAQVMTDTQWAILSQRGEVDFALDIPALARFRVNVYRQQRGIDVVFRIVPLKVPTFEELGLPTRLAKLADFRTGMVLFTGPSGSGKSTSLAALIGVLIGTRHDHLLTIENPIEYVFPKGACLVNQRQIGNHTEGFGRALRAALREDPDIIAITELRDRETMELAISAAETGHLVLGTLHTGSAGQTISRIVSSFPADEQEQVRVMLAESLRAVVSQRLVPQASGRGRVPAIELLMVNTAVSNLIRDDKTHQLPSVMQTGRAAGMITLDDSLAELAQAGAIAPEQARRFAIKKERFGG